MADTFKSYTFRPYTFRPVSFAGVPAPARKYFLDFSQDWGLEEDDGLDFSKDWELILVDGALGATP